MTRFVFAAFAAAVVVAPAHAQLRANRLATGLTRPVFATPAPDNPSLLYIVQQGGLIRTFDTVTNTLQSAATPFLNLGSVSGTSLIHSSNGGGNEQGFLGLAFSPDYATTGKLYTAYTSNAGGAFSVRVDEFTASGGVVNTASRRPILEVAHPGQTNHNGGWIGFNPVDAGTARRGQLYFSVGDGGSGNDPNNNAQNSNALLGKMLRVDVTGTSGSNNYSIPAGNMTFNPNNTTSAVRPEIYAYGLRNPWRNSFDRANGNFFIADVGQDNREEINFLANARPNTATAGLNFGWRLREGDIQTPTVGGPVPLDYVAPIHAYDRTVGASITGGYVYRGGAFTDFGSSLDGTYIFTDYISGKIQSFRYNPTTGVVSELRDRTSEIVDNLPGGVTLSGVSTFAEDGFGNLYILDFVGGGDIFRIVPVPEPACLLGVALAGAAGVWWRRGRAVRA